MVVSIKTFTAYFRYRENGILKETRKEIQTTSLKDAKITAKTLAQQQGLWLMEVR